MFHISINFSLHVPFTSCFLAVCGWGHMWSHRNEFPLGKPNCSSGLCQQTRLSCWIWKPYEAMFCWFIWLMVIIIFPMIASTHYMILYVHILSIQHFALLFFVSVCFRAANMATKGKETHSCRLIDQSRKSLGKFSSSMQQPKSKSW